MLSGQQVVKSFGAEEIESNRFRARVQRLRRSNRSTTSRSRPIASPLIEFFGAVTIVLLLVWPMRAPRSKHGEMITRTSSLASSSRLPDAL